MKTFIFPFLACCFLAFNALASKGVEIRHKTQFCAAEVYFRYPDRNPPQEEIDKSNRERTTVTLREYITLTATLDGKKLPKGTRCDWSAVEGGEYFKLDSIDNKPDQVIVNINTLAKARQTLKVKAEVDGVEQVVEFTLIPPQGLMYAGAESPFRQAEEEAAKVGCTAGLSALRILRVYPLNVSFTNLYSLEQHAGYEPDPLPDIPWSASMRLCRSPHGFPSPMKSMTAPTACIRRRSLTHSRGPSAGRGSAAGRYSDARINPKAAGTRKKKCSGISTRIRFSPSGAIPIRERCTTGSRSSRD